ncbi:MAG: TIGR04086 family membrane protein [Christensenellales bacterium]|jgi:putative membrane protein (TIGR04086 family)
MDNKMIKSSFDVARCVLYSLVISVFLVLGLALVIKFWGANSNTIMYINHGIKILSILLGVFIGTREVKMGAAKGALSGLIYILLSFLVFKLLAGQAFHLSIYDVILGTAAGLISGILTVNIKNK